MEKKVFTQRGSCAFLFPILCLLLFLQISQAGLVVYAHDSWGNLYTVDVETHQALLIGNTGRTFTDIAFNADKRLFGISNQTPAPGINMGLYEINPLTASITKIGDVGVGDLLNALVFDELGVLWSASDTSIVKIDPSTGVGTVFSTDVSPYGSAGDLAQDEFYNMYLTTDDGILLLIDRSDGSVSEVGSIPQDNVFGFARGDDNKMYGLTCSNQILLIDPQTGAGTVLGSILPNFNIGNTYWTSFPNEVPEPVTLFLLTVGVSITGAAKKS